MATYLWTLCWNIFIRGGLEIISKNLLINYCKPHGDIVALFPHPFLNPFVNFFPVRILFNNNMSPIRLWYVVCRDHSSSTLSFNCVFSIVWGLGELFNHIDAKIAEVKLTELFFFVSEKIEVGPSMQDIARLYLMLETFSSCSTGGGEDSGGAGVDSLERVSGSTNPLDLTCFRADFDIFWVLARALALGARLREVFMLLRVWVPIFGAAMVQKAGWQRFPIFERQKSVWGETRPKLRFWL